LATTRQEKGEVDRVDSTEMLGGGEAGALLRSIDWSTTSLGAASSWSQPLRTTVGLLLSNPFPMLLFWGSEHVQLYNDACRPLLGNKHPRAMGQPASACWSQIWPIIGGMIEAPFRGGPATLRDDLQLFVERKGFVEEAHFKVAYSPVADATTANGIGGVLATVVETTKQVYAHRQLRILRELAAHAVEATSPEEACASAALTFGENPADVPVALLYLFDDQGQPARLASWAGLECQPLTPPDAVGVAWPLRSVPAHPLDVFDDLLGYLGPALAPGWPARVRKAIVLALRSPEQPHAHGVLICGLSPHRDLDDGYRSFLELAAGQVLTAIRSARTRQRERERIESFARMERAQADFFSNVSHELRTPLTLMLGPLEDALSSGRPGLIGEELQLTYRNALRLSQLVNALLDFSRMEAGRTQASFEPLDLSALTAELAGAFRYTFERAGLRFRVHCDRLSEPTFVDREMWERIVLNLLSNAFKFTFEGEIELTLEAVGDQVELRVRDTGVGIASAELPRLFERFHRVEAARSRTHDGSGIGLALVRELVQLHGGQVRVQSVLGQGSSFVVQLRAGSAHLPPERLSGRREHTVNSGHAAAFVTVVDGWLPSDAEPDTLPGTVTPSGEGSAEARILIAEDDADMRAYLARKLGQHWTVRAVEDGPAALAVARVWKPHVLVSDVLMPGFSGFALLSELRDSPATKAISVIMLSARAGEEARLEGLEAGANDYLVKPFSARELMARVSTQVQLAKLRQFAESERARLLSFLMQLPVAITVFEGPNHRVALKNPLADEVTQGRLRLGESLVDLLPELEADGWIQRFDEIYISGQGTQPIPQPIRLQDAEGALQGRCFANVLQPLRDAHGIVTGILAAGYDVASSRSSAGPAEAPPLRHSVVLPVVSAGENHAARRVLVVDDDEETATLMADALRERGHTVCVAHDGPAALAVAASFEPQLALIDIGLPLMDGYELGRRLRQAATPGAELELIAITGYGRESDRRRSLEAGFDRHVVKPVTLAALGDFLSGTN
jgi:signal transduction histidine kinase/DNA-binding response OmpR family regulator